VLVDDVPEAKVADVVAVALYPNDDAVAYGVAIVPFTPPDFVA
jgi:hypothetical protein